MPDDSNSDPKSGAGGDSGQGAFGDEKKKKDESGIQPKGSQNYSQKYGEKEKTWGDDTPAPGSEDDKKGTKTTTKVTVWKKDLVKEKQGFLGPHAGNPEDEQDPNSIGLLYYKAGVKSELSFDLKKKEGELTLVNAEGQFSVVHGQAKGEWNVGDLIRGVIGAIPGGPGGGPMAARVNDLTAHGSPLMPGIGSTDVLIGNMPAWRAQMDFHACPIVKGLIPDVGGMVMFGSPTVMIDFMMACRMGDMVVEIPGGPNPIVMGCPTVMIGSAGAGGGGGGAKAGGGPTVSGEASGDLLTAKAEAKAGIVVDKDQAQLEAKAGAMAAVAQGELKGALNIPLWGDHSVSLGVGVQGSVLSAGAEAHADAGWNKDQGFHVGAGAKAGVGLGGAGIGFSLGFK